MSILELIRIIAFLWPIALKAIEDETRRNEVWKEFEKNIVTLINDAMKGSQEK